MCTDCYSRKKKVARRKRVVRENKDERKLEVAANERR